MKIAVIGNYPPRKCGIATYTENFVQSLLGTLDPKTSQPNQIDVFAMNDKPEGYDYPSIVKQCVFQENKEDYYKIAKTINNGQYDYCHIQHEYGIFGGKSGLFVNIFLSQIKIPIFITLHSVVKSLNFHQQQILENMRLFATQLIVMTEYAKRILMDFHQFPDEKITIIQHGAPSFEELNKVSKKEAFGWSGFTILMTFGLIGRSKGIETAIKALPEIIIQFPNTLYVVLGKTHPHIVKNEGEVYRESLIELADELGVNKHVLFLDKYVSENELMDYLGACDLYITPYANEAQITSGTLTYAVSSGAAVLSTPYWHAIELLADGRGMLFDFNSHGQLAGSVLDLMKHPAKLHVIQQLAFDYGKTITWNAVSNKTIENVQLILKTITQKTSNTEQQFLDAIPELSLEHFYNLTDQTGMLQHASYSIPDYSHGYCTDDNARALIMAIKLYRLNPSMGSQKLITKFLSFLNYMQLENGTFVNMLSYSKNHLPNNRSEDAFGRAIWALGYSIKHAPLLHQKTFAMELFLKALPNFKALNDLRGIAGSITGIVLYLNYDKNFTELKVLLEELLNRLVNSYVAVSDKTWHWYETKISYDNAVLPLALFTGAAYLKKQDYFKIAMESLAFLEKFSFKNGHLSLVGNDKWLEKGKKKSLFSQQPIDASSLSLLYHCLYKITSDKKYKAKMVTSFSWFLGNNDLYTSLYDKQSKGCSDGMFEDSLNLNQGGESLLAWLNAYLTFKLTEESC
ncbi:MAG TPA: glycosyl transferase [Bacteroidales bacterium]|nr:glycosyl transferase [Bacteroidales bacterium]